MTAIQQAPNELVRTRLAEDEQRFVLHHVSWETYEKLLDAFGDCPIRLTYDRGKLELLSPSWNHESWKRRIGLVITYVCIELNIDIQGGGSPTFRRRDQEHGLEPDECFYIEHVAAVQGLREIDLTRDPPPDLAIEIDISRSSLDRQSIYAALGVPELWCFEGEALQVYRLQPDGSYAPCPQSPSLPFLPMSELAPFLQQTQGLNDLQLFRAVRDWVRQRILPSWQGKVEGGQSPS